MTVNAGASSMLYRQLRRGVGWYATLDVALIRGRDALSAFFEAALCRALTPDEKMDLTVYLYDLRATTRAGRRERLFDWEVTWFEQALPPAPAHLLLGAAGAGREASWLTARGYTVDAFEPAPHCGIGLRAAVGSGGLSATGSYADLIAAVRQGRDNPLGIFAARRYDAIILGWGSLGHLLGAALRGELIAACDALCPAGPLLASFAFSAEPASAPARQSRAADAGRRAGQLIAQLRGEPIATDGVRFLSHAGFYQPLRPDELDRLAAASGRIARLFRDDYPHATFLKSP